jgi:hypothetical protein
MQRSQAESEALHLAILFQVPTTWPEALVLQYHVHNAADPYTELNDTEKRALEVGLDTLFDFMCDEIDHEERDGIFQRAECLVSERRQLRTGIIAKAA